MEATFEDQLLLHYKMLLTFATSLTGKRESAKDLVQETMVRALTHKAQFIPGTNLAAWLVTILRNKHFSDGRKKHREVAAPDGDIAMLQDLVGQHTQGSFDDAIELSELGRYIDLLSPEHQHAVMSVGYLGNSYEQAADEIGAFVGTIKSRVSRARERLQMLRHRDEERASMTPRPKALVQHKTPSLQLRKVRHENRYEEKIRRVIRSNRSRVCVTVRVLNSATLY
jgi:RNA polymerase sigma-70 factor (ECF subfamily)